MPHPCSRCGATAFQTAGAMLCPACLLRLASLPQSRIPAFEIETLIGSGPSGTSYLARAAGGALLAVRKLAGGASFTPSIEDLGARLAAFTHPHVAPVYGLQPDDDGVSIVREFVRGRPFADWASAAAPEARAAAVDAISAAVAALHAAGLPHGNITPTNIVIRGTKPVLLDSGARLVALALRTGGEDVGALREADAHAVDTLRTAAATP